MGVVLIGGGGFAKEVAQYALDVGKSIKGILSKEAPSAELAAHAHLGDEASYAIAADDEFVIAIGDARIRQRAYAGLEARGVRWASIVHPTAYIAPSAQLGPGAIICPFAFVGVHARLGAHVVLNTYASVGHDAIVGDCTVFSPYSCINGWANLGEAVFLGSQAVVTPKVVLGGISKVAAGSVVTQDAPRGSLLMGNPAKGRVMFR